MAASRRGTTFSVCAVTAVVMAVVAGGCGSKKSQPPVEATASTSSEVGQAEVVDEGDPTEGGSLVFGMTAETNGWNPALDQWSDSSHFIASTFFEPLFVYNTAGELVPWLAESSSMSDDAKAWTVTLRPGIRFHDGSELTAQTMVDGIMLGATKGLSSVAYGDLIAGATATDTLTFTVDLTVPWAAYPHTLAGQPGIAMAEVMVSDPTGAHDAPVGTGAYVFDQWTPDTSLTVTRNDDYWGGPCALDEPGEKVAEFCEEVGIPVGQPNGPFLDKLDFRPLVDSQQRANALKAGDLDVILTNDPADVEAMAGDHEVVTDYHSEKSILQLNVERPPFDNIHARKAVAHAIDRQALVDQIAAGQPVASDTSPFSQTSPWGGVAPDDTGYPLYDPAAAEEEIRAYLDDTGEESLNFTIEGVATPVETEVLEAVADQLRAVGIETQLESTEQASFITKLIGGDYQTVFFRAYAYVDPDSNYVFWSNTTMEPPIIINFSHFATESTQEALVTGRESTDFETRKEAYQSLALERNEAVTDVWLYNTPYALIAEPNVRGLNPFRVLPWGDFLPKPYLTGIWVEDS